MNTEVKKRIDREREEKTGKLDLSNCKLESIPLEINSLTWLLELNLSSNEISKIENLETLTAINWLNLYINIT